MLLGVHGPPVKEPKLKLGKIREKPIGKLSVSKKAVFDCWQLMGSSVVWFLTTKTEKTYFYQLFLSLVLRRVV